MSKSPPIAPPADHLLAMARFLVLPGAERLLTAYAQIPPGGLRESSIAHVEAIAAAYNGAPAANQMGDPLHLIAGGSITAPAIGAPAPQASAEARGGRRPKVESIEGQATDLRFRGHDPRAIATKLGVPLHHVGAILRDARKAGAKFPAISAQPRAHGGGKYHVSLDTVSNGGMGRVVNAAAERGISPEDYMARRRLVLEMGVAGRHPLAIAAASKEPVKVVGAWLSLARACGHKVPYSSPIITAEFEPVKRPNGHAPGAAP